MTAPNLEARLLALEMAVGILSASADADRLELVLAGTLANVDRAIADPANEATAALLCAARQALVDVLAVQPPRPAPALTLVQ